MKKEAPAFWASMPKLNYTIHKGKPAHEIKGDAYLRMIFKGYPPIKGRLYQLNGGLQ